jgi:hypothetical protein
MVNSVLTRDSVLLPESVSSTSIVVDDVETCPRLSVGLRVYMTRRPDSGPRQSLHCELVHSPSRVMA